MVVNILLCDDNIHSLRTTENLISQYNHTCLYKIISSTNSEELLMRTATLQADIAILDIHMKPINGIALAYKMKERNVDIVIIFTTAYPDFTYQACKLGCLNYLIKPFFLEEFIHVLDNAFRRYQQAFALKKKQNILAIKINKEIINIHFETLKNLFMRNRYFLLQASGTM